MANRKTLENLLGASALVVCSLILSGSAEAQKVMAQPPYTITPFVHSGKGFLYSKPDSLVQWNDSVLVGYGNGVDKSGLDGKSSTIVQYSLRGTVQRMCSVLGHNDGLRIKPGTNELWALQNEDGNPNAEPNLVIIDLENLERKNYVIPSVNGGGGYDEIVFDGDKVFISASNPQGGHYPGLIRLTLAGSTVITEEVLNDDGSAVNIPTGHRVEDLGLTDPDSLTIDPRGNLVLDSQGDSELVFIRHPGTEDQTVGLLPITPSTVDDTAFAPSSPRTFLLAADINGDTVYRIDSDPFGFEPGVAYSGSDTDGIIGVLDLDNGVLTPFVTSTADPMTKNLSSFRGLLFVVPEEENNDRGR